MDMDFADGMRTAMRLVQAQKLMEATRVIQSILSGTEQSEPPTQQAATDRAIEGPIIDLTAEVIEADMMTVPEGEANVPRAVVAAERCALDAADGRDGPDAGRNWTHPSVSVR
jgi:hypothetical protein